jgi:hypothetical protein
MCAFSGGRGDVFGTCQRIWDMRAACRSENNTTQKPGLKYTYVSAGMWCRECREMRRCIAGAVIMNALWGRRTSDTGDRYRKRGREKKETVSKSGLHSTKPQKEVKQKAKESTRNPTRSIGNQNTPKERLKESEAQEKENMPKRSKKKKKKRRKHMI